MIDRLIAFSIWLSEINIKLYCHSNKWRCNFWEFSKLHEIPVFFRVVFRFSSEITTFIFESHLILFSIIGELAHSRFLLKNPLSDSFPPESPPLNCIMLFKIGDISDLNRNHSQRDTLKFRLDIRMFHNLKCSKPREFLVWSVHKRFGSICKQKIYLRVITWYAAHVMALSCDCSDTW